jgi:hypothetical protein
MTLLNTLLLLLSAVAGFLLAWLLFGRRLRTATGDLREQTKLLEAAKQQNCSI